MSLYTDMLHSGVSHCLEILPGTVTSTSVQVMLTMFSRQFDRSDVDFYYRLSGQAWQSDAVISKTTSGSISGNTLYDMDCSRYGTENVFVWEYASNGLVSGQGCEVKAVLKPKVKLLSTNDNGSIVESISGQKTISKSDMAIYNTDLYGRSIVISSNAVSILNETGTAYTFSATSPAYCLQMPNENYLILYNDRYVDEREYDGTVVQTWDNASLLSGVKALDYDKDANTLLFASPSGHMAYEVSWKSGNKGTTLWSHGTGVGGSGATQLDTPNHAIYGPNSMRYVYIADTENDRIAVIDRVADSTSFVTELTYESKPISLVKPYFLTASGNDVWFVEKEQEQESFNDEAVLHPALMRYEAISDPSGVSGKDATTVYNNLMFRPIAGAV